MSIKIDTKFVQTFLNYTGYSMKVLGNLLATDNKPGPVTEKVIKKYQEEKGLYRDGFAGPFTQKEIIWDIQKIFNDKGISKACTKEGYDLSTDGVFGSVTTQVTKCFQGKVGIAQDGIFYLVTLKALMNYKKLAEKPSPTPKPSTRILYFISPDATPLDKIDFQILRSQGITDVAVPQWHINPDDMAKKVKPITDKAGITLHSWCWDGTSLERIKTLVDNKINVLMDMETYEMKTKIQYLSTIHNLTNGKVEFTICVKPDGWDGDQAYTELSKYCDYIMPMLYTGDYHKSTAELKSFMDTWNKKLPGKIWPCLETYKSDKDYTPKTKEVLLNEINTVKDYTKKVALFRYGLSKFETPTNTTIPPISTNAPPTGWIRIYYTRDSQDTNYTCGPSSLKMALSVYGLYYNENTLKNLVGAKPGIGTSNYGIINAVNNLGKGLKAWEETFRSWETLRDYLLKGWPVILRVSSWITRVGQHYVLLCGLNVENGLVELGDPSNGGFRSTTTTELREKIRKVNSPSIIIISK